MTKYDLKPGMVVEVKNGKKYLVLQNHEDDSLFLAGVVIGEVYNLTGYDKEMVYQHDSSMTIVKVFSITIAVSLFNLLQLEYAPLKLLWERYTPKEMTITEIENILGYPVKIVEEEP